MGFGNRFSNLPIRFKLIIRYSFVFITAIVLINFFVYTFVKHILNTSINNELDRFTSTILNIVKTSADASIKGYLNGIAVQNRNMAVYFYEQYKKDLIKEEDAKQMAIQVILNQPVGLTGYIYCLDSTGTMVVHPEEKRLGTNLSEYKFIQNQKKLKQGYIEYEQKSPGEQVARPKALYMVYFEPWDWIISASIYRNEFAQLVQINDFKDKILPLTFGTTGYSYIVDGNENIIIHPDLDNKGLSQKRMDIDQIKISERVKTICKIKNGKMTFPVKSKNDGSVREKFVIFNHIKEFNWIVVSSGFMDELYAPLKKIKTIFPVTILAGLIFVLFFSYSIGTEQKKIQREMARTRLHLWAILDSIPSVLIGVDTSGSVTMWNMEAIKTSHVSELEALGKKLTHISPGLDIAMGMADMANVDKKIQIKESVIHPFLGEGAWADIVVYPLTDKVGYGSLIRIDDVSTKLKMKDLMVQTEKMKIIAGLSAGMAHEINNPISCIVQSTQNILRRVSPKLEANKRVAKDLGTDLSTIYAYLKERQIIKFIEDIHISVERTARTVSNMLGFSRNKEPVKTLVDLSHLIESSVALAAHDYELKKKYDFKRIQIIQDIEPGLKKVICIPSEIEQVIFNLIKNAAQAIGGMNKQHFQPIIKIKLTQGDKSVKIQFEDNGPGMDKAVQKQIFEPFFTTRSVGSGTGLGLCVAYYIVTRNHNGTLTVKSKQGKGAAFSITLPCEE